MSAAILRNMLPVVTSVAATLYLAAAVPHGRVPEVAAVDFAAGGIASGGAGWLAREDDDAPRRASRQ